MTEDDIAPGPAHGGARANTGGARTGAGRPKKDAPPTELQAANLEFARQRAAHEKTKHQQRVLKLKIESGEYVSRQAVRDASAASLLMVANGLRGIGDHLEAQGLDLLWCEKVNASVDHHLEELAKLMKLFSSQSDE